MLQAILRFIPMLHISSVNWRPIRDYNFNNNSRFKPRTEYTSAFDVFENRFTILVDIAHVLVFSDSSEFITEYPSPVLFWVPKSDCQPLAGLALLAFIKYDEEEYLGSSLFILSSTPISFYTSVWRSSKQALEKSVNFCQADDTRLTATTHDMF